MVFKFNISHKGRTYKAETDNEGLIRMKIGDKLDGSMISADLGGYSLEITGTSDIAGFPGIKGQVGGQLRRILLTKDDLGMNTTKPKGLRLKKSVRGEEISEKTLQINTKVLKEGSKKFDELCPAKAPKEKNDDKSKKAAA
jgi:ribosomal protein S6E (S10)